jgi:site-specific recombinase XerD
MDKSNPQVSNNLPLELDQLVARALNELEKLRYSRRSLRRYRTIWRKLVTFSHELNLGGKYSEHLAAQFCNAYQMHDGECLKPSEGWRRHVMFGLKVLGDFARDGCIERTVTDMEKIQVPALMKKPLRDYEQYCRDRLYLRPTSLRERMREIAIFADFLGSRDITTLDQMQPADLSAFVISLHRLAAKSVSRIVSDLRSFLRFLLLRGILQRDLSPVLPKIRIPQDATIPSVWDPELVVRLLDVVDRGSPRGKRDYAILLLACRLGLRAADIRALRLDDLNWEAATIEIAQSKTLAPLCLPLTEEVGEALIDYLKSGRPQTAHREVFLTLVPPFAPFENGNLYHIVTYWRQLAGIRFRTKQRHGLHSLRHTLATQLLREQTPFHVISEILGHATTASTLIYAKADVEALRTAALDTEEVRHVE